MRIIGAIFGLAAFLSLSLAAGQAIAQGRGANFDPAGCDPYECSESDWIYDDNRTDHTTVWRHDLGFTPRSVTVLFSPDPDRGRVMPLIWPWQWNATGNPTGVEMGRRAVRLHISAGLPLHGIWRSETGWTS